VSINQNQTVAMSASDITAINNNGTFKYEIFSESPNNYDVYLTVTLTGTFPQPAPPITPATEPIEVPVQVIFQQRTKCMLISPPFYVFKDISKMNFPIAYQFKMNAQYDWLQIIPGLFNFNGANGNANCSLQLWEGEIANLNGWYTSWNNPNSNPVHVQLAQSPIMIPWNKDINGYLVVKSFLTSAPANSQIEFVLKGFNL
jgi:hypothetical protein